MGDRDGRPEELDVHSVKPWDEQDWKKAETFRKAEIFGRAAKFFREVWDQHQAAEAGWRYAHCLRKTGYAEVALGLLKDLARSYPEHEIIREELIWCLYDGRLMPAKLEGKSAEVLEAAKDMVAAGAEGNALKLAVFSVMNLAKSKGQWRNLSNWCDLLDPNELSDLQRGNAKQTIPSDRERWYYAKVKALVSLQEWHLAQEAAEQACQSFPRNPNFLRWKANALAGLGEYQAAIALLESLRPSIAWYALADMAKYAFELEEVERALVLGLEAARAQGQDSAKVNLWELLAKTYLALDQAELALPHLGLMVSIRDEQGWPLRPSHLQLQQRVLQEVGIEHLPKRSSKDWKRDCRLAWGDSVSAAPRKKQEDRPLGRGDGRVTGLEEGRSFAFIRPQNGKELIFVLVKDLPGEGQKNGVKVSFQMIKHFDKKKNRESLRAVDVQVLEVPDEEWGPAITVPPSNV